MLARREAVPLLAAAGPVADGPGIKCYPKKGCVTS